MKLRSELLAHLRSAYVGVGVIDDLWTGLDVTEDGDDAVVTFNWADDPHIYAVRLRLDAQHPFWWYEPRGGLLEELQTGLIERAPRRSVYGVIELDLDAPRPDPPVVWPKGTVDSRIVG